MSSSPRGAPTGALADDSMIDFERRVLPARCGRAASHLAGRTSKRDAMQDVDSPYQACRSRPRAAVRRMRQACPTPI